MSGIDFNAPVGWLPNLKTIHVNIPIVNGFYDLITLAQGLDYLTTDEVGAIRIKAILDGAEELEIKGTNDDIVDDAYGDRGVYVHGPLTVRLDPETLVFKINALKQAPGLVLRVAVFTRRIDVTNGATQ